MKKTLKWLLIIGGGLILALFVLGLIIPKFIDKQKYRSLIENELSKATARPFKLDGELRLTLFPWASVAISDVHLENPAGFEEKDFISVASFEVQVKLMPLITSLFKDIQIKRFNLKGARIVLEKTKDGRANWEGIGKGATQAPPVTGKKREEGVKAEPVGAIPIQAIAVGEFAISDGSLLYMDHTKGERFDVSDLNLDLKDVSLDRPIQINFSVLADGHPVSLDGKVGPLGRDLSKAVIPIDLSFNALRQLDVKVKGSVSDISSNPRFDLSVDVLSFSPRKLVAEMGQEFPVVTADPNTLIQAAFRADLKGDTGKASVSNGLISIDESKLTFSGKARDFSKPDVTFDLKLDQIDLDRYLPPETDKKSEVESTQSGTPKQKETQTKGPKNGRQKTDYSPLRKLVLESTIQVGKLKAANVRLQDLVLKVVGKNGVFHLDPLSLNLYDGSISVKETLDLTKDVPKSNLDILVKDINSGPLFVDIADKDILEGKLNAEITLRTEGDVPEKIKQSLNGNGNFFVKDGALKGIDLVAMVRNTDGAYGFSGKSKEKPRTRFDELEIPFTIKNGIFYTDSTRLTSALLSVQTAGKADLVKETLDFRVEPTVVTTRKEDKEKMKRSEVAIPVLVTGSFSDPTFLPDLKGIAKKKLEEDVFESRKFKKVFEKEELKPIEKDAKKLLKGILE